MTRKKHKSHSQSYLFNKTGVLYPTIASDKIKPPKASVETQDTKNLFQVKKELTLDEQAQNYMDNYRRVERAVVINFYTGGGAYKRGILDAIYRGFNPLNP